MALVHAIVCAHPWIVGGLALVGPLFLLYVAVLHLSLHLSDRRRRRAPQTVATRGRL